MVENKPARYACSAECWRWLGGKDPGKPAWVYVAFSAELDVGDDGWSQIGDKLHQGDLIPIVKIGKAEGCLQCRILELNGILSPRLAEKRKRGEKIVDPAPWCGARGWQLWGSRTVREITNTRAEKHKIITKREKNTQEKFFALNVSHIWKGHGEIYYFDIDDHLWSWISILRDFHDADLIDECEKRGEDFDCCYSEEAERQQEIGMAKIVCNFLDLQSAPSIDYSPKVKASLEANKDEVFYDMNFRVNEIWSLENIEMLVDPYG